MVARFILFMIKFFSIIFISAFSVLNIIMPVYAMGVFSSPYSAYGVELSGTVEDLSRSFTITGHQFCQAVQNTETPDEPFCVDIWADAPIKWVGYDENLNVITSSDLTSITSNLDQQYTFTLSGSAFLNVPINILAIERCDDINCASYIASLHYVAVQENSELWPIVGDGYTGAISNIDNVNALMQDLVDDYFSALFDYVIPIFGVLLLLAVTAHSYRRIRSMMS